MNSGVVYGNMWLHTSLGLQTREILKSLYDCDKRSKLKFFIFEIL